MLISMQYQLNVNKRLSGLLFCYEMRCATKMICFKNIVFILRIQLKQMMNIIRNTMIMCLIFSMKFSMAQLSPQLEQRFKTVLDSVCSKYRYKGVTTSVLLPGMGIWNGVYGISHDTVTIKPQMAFGMGSNTKTFIGVLLLKMQAAQLLSLDDSIGKWIQGYPHINGKATIRQCLNHTSGIAEYLDARINDSLLNKPEKIWTKEEILGFAPAAYFNPGAGWRYSNTNYVIAGVIIEKVLNKSAQVAMREWVLDSANLNHTFFYGETNSATIPHQWTMNLTGTGLVDMNTAPINIIPQMFSMATTAGAMMTTAEDNVKFWHSLVKGNLLTPQSYKELTQWVNVNSSLVYGLGIFRMRNAINNRTILTHGGTFLGFINENMVDTLNGVTIAVLTNQDSLDNGDVSSQIMKALHLVTLDIPNLSINETIARKSLTAYPNPAHDKLFISTNNGIALDKVTICDLQGRTLDMHTWNGYFLDVSKLPNGLYLIEATSNDGHHRYTKRVMIQHSF